LDGSLPNGDAREAGPSGPLVAGGGSIALPLDPRNQTSVWVS
jgi:hypothetical protein